MKLPIKLKGDRYAVYINGEWRDPEARGTFSNINPAHKTTLLGRVSECTEAEIDQAMDAAAQAFAPWRAVSGNIRTKLFLHLAQVLYANYDQICSTMTREMGKTLYDSRLDLDEAIAVVETIAPQGLALKGETYQKNIDGLVMESRLEPRGVAAIITPFNFPVAIPIAQIVSALVTGNTVVWKPSHLVPESSQAIIEAIREAITWTEERLRVKIPAGILNMVSGDMKAGDAVVRHPIPKAISFTGSKTVGDAVDAIASGLGKKVMKEVGGINCFYVHRNADVERAVRNFIYGKTITAGQRCTSIQEVLLDSEIYDWFLETAHAVASRIVYGDGASPEIADGDARRDAFSLPPLVSEQQQKRAMKLIDQAVAEGAHVRLQLPIPEPLKAEGYYVPFTIIDNVGPENILRTTEIFAPVAVLVPVSNVRHAIQHINDKVGIVACIDTTNKDVAETFIQDVLRTRVDDGRHGTGAFPATRFGGDRGAGSGNPALDENMVYGYVMWKTIYRAYRPQ